MVFIFPFLLRCSVVSVCCYTTTLLLVHGLGQPNPSSSGVLHGCVFAPYTGVDFVTMFWHIHPYSHPSIHPIHPIHSSWDDYPLNIKSSFSDVISSLCHERIWSFVLLLDLCFVWGGGFFVGTIWWCCCHLRKPVIPSQQSLGRRGVCVCVEMIKCSRVNCVVWNS